LNIFFDSQPAAVVERAPQPVEAPLAKDRVDVNVEEVSPLEEEVENVPLEVSIFFIMHLYS